LGGGIIGGAATPQHQWAGRPCSAHILLFTNPFYYILSPRL